MRREAAFRTHCSHIRLNRAALLRGGAPRWTISAPTMCKRDEAKGREFELQRQDCEFASRRHKHGTCYAETRMTRKSLTLVRVGPVTTRSPSAEKKL